MKGYVEEGAFLSCSFDIVGTPQKLQRHFSTEGRKVQYSDGKRLLTETDKNTLACFKCKSPAKFWGGMIAFVGAVAIGAALILSGPVGWIALAAIAAVAIATTVAVFAHDCSDKQSAGEWMNLHKTVKIKGDQPLLYQFSILTCGVGGLLIASETQAGAQKVSDSMKYNARQELAVQILSQAIYGLATGLTTPAGGAGAGIAVFNAAAGAGIYSIGESNTKGGIIASGVKLYGADKTIGLISSSSKNLVGAAFAKDFFMGRSGFLAGAAVTVLSTAADYYWINPLEESLENKNSMSVRDLHLENSGSGKKIISLNN